jgi:hypothetical protein
MGVKNVEAYGDSLLVVQQVSKVCQCLNGSLNAYLDICLDIISSMDEFVIYHVPREENPKANALAQQASGYNVQKRNFQEWKPMFGEVEGYVLEDQVQPPPQVGQTGYPGQTAPSGWLDRPLGVTLLRPLFLPVLLRTKWEIGEHLWLSFCRILKV